MTGLAFLVVLLGVLAGTVGLSGSGWLVGIAAGVVMSVLLVGGLERRGTGGLGPADRVTLVRAVLVCCVAALAASSFSRPTPVATLVGISAVALGLDAVDGWVARRTASASSLGARFDMEVDAFLILVLSVYVARSAGAWVLMIGVARYAFVTARRLLPRMRGEVPSRYWCKVVAAAQGVVLTVVAADVAPHRWEYAALTVSLVLLAESFGRETWGLWHADAEPHAPAELSAVGVVVAVGVVADG